MADIENNGENASEKDNAHLENFNVDESYLNEKMADVSNLVVMARLQAKEAEIRAKYAKEFANRAVAEALAAHQVSLSLANTSRMVAALALEVSNETSLLNESFVDSDNDSRYASFLSPDVSLQSAGDQCALTNDVPTDDDVTTLLKPGSTLNKYDTQFPEDIDASHEQVSADKPLPTVYEDSLNEQSGDSLDVKSETKQVKGTMHPDLAEEMKNLEIRRKMMLYRDSKLMPCNFINAAKPEQVIKRSYIEQGTQTNVMVE